MAQVGFACEIEVKEVTEINEKLKIVCCLVALLIKDAAKIEEGFRVLSEIALDSRARIRQLEFEDVQEPPQSTEQHDQPGDLDETGLDTSSFGVSFIHVSCTIPTTFLYSEMGEIFF